MQSERPIEAAIEKCSNGEQGKPSFSSVEESGKNEQQQKQNEAAFLKHQLQVNGIVLTKLQIPKWSPNVSEQTQNSIMNTFYLGRQPILAQQQILEKQVSEQQQDKQKLFDNGDILNGSSAIVPINSISSTMANYNTMNSDETIDSKYSSDCHINNGYVSSDAHSLEYNNDFTDQNPYNSQSSINHRSTADFNHDDSTKSAIKELFIPIMLSGLGNMGAGIILDSAQTWTVFMKIPQLIVLVPALLGLKGNVEMTLSSRLGTCANLGELQDKKKRKSIVIGNVSLAQCQASGVGLIAPFIAISLSMLQIDQSENTLTMPKTMLILASSVMTSGLADLMLSSFMCFIVIISVTKLKINADNIATPIAASVGDLLTMVLFAMVSRTLYTYSLKYSWLPFVPISIWLCIISFTGFIARRNQHTSKLIYTGWTTLMISMMIQNTSGTVMETFFRRYSKMAAFQPVINGFGGNLVAVQSSRIATYLHKNCKKRQLPATDPRILVSPWKILFGKNKHGKLALILILMAAPLQLPYVFMLRYITANAIITPAFLITYYICCTVQVTLMLYFGYMFVHLLWKWGFNPDNNAIPILTACADLIGSTLFALGFLFLDSIQDPNAMKSDSIINSFNQTIASTSSFAPALNATTTNGLLDLMTNSSTVSSLLNTSTIANTLNTLIANHTESATVLSNLTTLLGDNINEIVNNTVTLL